VYARIAVERKDWVEALRRWNLVSERFGYFGGYVGSAQALIQLGCYEDAEELLQQARYRFGTEPGPLSELARVAEAKSDRAEAMERWKTVLRRFPLDPSVYSSTADAFERLGEPAEAESTLRAAIDQFTGKIGPMLELAKLFHYKRQDFPAAAEAWAALRAHFPDNEEAYTLGSQALFHAGRTEEAEALLAEHRCRYNAS